MTRRRRKTINDWVAAQTNDKIQNLLGKGSIQPHVTKLIITNAVYFKGDWLLPFDANHTSNFPFHVRGAAETTPAATMHQTAQVGYMENDSFQAIELPYAHSNLAMLIVLPKATDGFPAVEAHLDTDLLGTIDKGLGNDRVAIALPKFKFAASLDLAQPLTELGMKAAFDPSAADFSGMDNQRDLYVSGVVHQAYVAVDEKGTEAAAATGIMVGATAIIMPPPQEFRADHPFIFAIRDKQTGAIMFLGRVVDPASGE